MPARRTRRPWRNEDGVRANPLAGGCMAPRGVFIDIEMEVQTFTIRNRLGLHARAAALLVKTANRFTSEITIEKDSLEVNGKSIMGILMLAASKGSKITLKAEGKDAALAIETLGELIQNKFGEE
jgi:phosphocarrier protein HPr